MLKWSFQDNRIMHVIRKLFLWQFLRIFFCHVIFEHDWKSLFTVWFMHFKVYHKSTILSVKYCVSTPLNINKVRKQCVNACDDGNLCYDVQDTCLCAHILGTEMWMWKTSPPVGGMALPSMLYFINTGQCGGLSCGTVYQYLFLIECKILTVWYVHLNFL